MLLVLRILIALLMLQTLVKFAVCHRLKRQSMLLVLRILIALLMLQTLVKFAVFFTLGYHTRRNISPVKMMSYAIQANPEKPWKQLAIITFLAVWVLYRIIVG